jgi:hypothetical protein
MSFHKLDSDQKLFDGSNPILAELYRRTAERLNEIMDAVGGPGRTISSTFQVRPQLIHSLRPWQKIVGLLPQVKMRAKADSLPHVIVRAC